MFAKTLFVVADVKSVDVDEIVDVVTMPVNSMLMTGDVSEPPVKDNMHVMHVPRNRMLSFVGTVKVLDDRKVITDMEVAA